MTLRERIIRAGTWTVVSYATEIITRFASSLIMTRLLVPEAFGMVAASMAIIVGLQLMSDFGVRTVIIQSPRGDDAQFLRSGWTFQAVRGGVLWMVLIAICTLLLVPAVRRLLPPESVYASNQFPYVAIALGFSIVLSGLESTTLSLNVRKLNFRPIFISDLISRSTPLPVMVISSLYYPNVWAIVAGTLVGGFARMALSHAIIPGPTMWFSYRRDHIIEIISFGKWINLASFSTFIGSQSDYIILGILLPGPMIGIYYLAKTLYDAIEGLLERLNSAMTLPVMGEVVRNNPGFIADRYYRFRLPLELLATTSGGFLFAAADAIIHFLYDERYQGAGAMLRALSIGLVLYPFPLIRSAFTATGEAYVTAWVSVIQAISFIMGLVLGYYIAGPLGAVAGGMLSRTVPALVILCMAYRRNWMIPLYEIRCLPASVAGLFLGYLVTYLLAPYTVTDVRHFFLP